MSKEMKNLEWCISPNNDEMKNLEWCISHNMDFIQKNRDILDCLDVILPAGDDYKVITKKGEILLTDEDIFIIKTAVRCSMEECAAWTERKTKELEEMKNDKAKEE